jgi:hypothetical protein
MTVSELLARAGVDVDADEFVALVASVLDDIGPAPADDPSTALSAKEIEALRAVDADVAPRRARERDPRVDATATYAAVIAAGRSVAEVADQLGIDSSRVRHRLARKQLVGIRRTDGWRLPAWQFTTDGSPLPGLEKVLRALPEPLHPVTVAKFFATPVPELRVGRRALSPRDWLAGGGDPAAVVALTHGLDLFA